MRHCAVAGCVSGRHSDREAKKKLGVKQTTLFKVPKDPDLRAKWSAALDLHLHEKDSICELHFRENDIQKTYDTIMPGGKVATLARGKFSLVQNAVPIARDHEKTQDHIASSTQSTSVMLDVANEKTRETAHPDAIKDTISDSIITLGLDAHQKDQTSDMEVDRTEFLQGDLSNVSTMNEIRSSTPLLPNINNDFCATFDDVSADSFEPTANNNHILQETPILFENDVTRLNLDIIKRYFNEHPLRQSWTWHEDQSGQILFTQINKKTRRVRCYVECFADLSIKVSQSDGQVINGLNTTASSIDDIINLLKKVEAIILCEGTGVEKTRRSPECCGIVVANQNSSKYVHFTNCLPCRSLKKQLTSPVLQLNTSELQYKDLYYDAENELKLLQQRYQRSCTKVEELNDLIKQLNDKFDHIRDVVIEEKISKLPPSQQQVVKTCFASSETEPRQRRYPLDYIYDSLLMRIKSKKLYEHMRDRQILPLPCRDTINNYIKNLDNSYGFQKPVFDTLHEKSTGMKFWEKRGTLLIDEMSLSEAIALDKKNMKFKGFVDLGEHTPAEQQTKRGDHALVFMYQPFGGGWVQVLGCFLSRHSVTSAILHKLILECIILLGLAGLQVDAVTMDGAQWNRGVWTLFGIDTENVWCEHPYYPSKKLFFVSDFPHLIKCMRNTLMSPKISEFETPDGIVKKAHWKALLKYENYTKPNMKMAHKLKEKHINPQGYQKMRVPLAYELFDPTVSAAMEFLRDRTEELSDCKPTVQFIKRINSLIEVMSSRTGKDALNFSDSCPNKKVLREFLEYLDDWEACYASKKTKLPVSASTMTGLRVTIRSTLQLIDYLHEENHEFTFLMTSKLSQDALERFFGMVRSACGSNDHPDPILFASIFRLLCCYSLIKPSKGSNVSGSQLLHTLMQTKDIMEGQKSDKKKWLDRLDELVEQGYNTQNNERHDEDGAASDDDPLIPHDYDVAVTDEAVLAYMSGYVVHKCDSFTKCTDCLSSLKTNKPSEKFKFIDLMNRGGLTYPAPDLLELVTRLESVVLDVVGKKGMHVNTLFQIMESIKNIDLPKVGCPIHFKELAKKIINFYLIMRGHFLSESFDINAINRKEQEKNNRKNAKY